MQSAEVLVKTAAVWNVSIEERASSEPFPRYSSQNRESDGPQNVTEYATKQHTVNSLTFLHDTTTCGLGVSSELQL